jgi:hypothetical protein
VGPVIKVAAVLLCGLAISSGLLYRHYQSQQSYTTFESLYFLTCLFFSLLNLIWIAPALLFL